MNDERGDAKQRVERLKAELRSAEVVLERRKAIEDAERKKSVSRRMNTALLVLAPIALFLVWYQLRQDAEIERRAAAERAAVVPVSDAECQQSLECWSKRHELNMLVACRQAVERSAAFEIEWTDGLLESKFEGIHTADPVNGSLMTRGNKLKMQNEFGAWRSVAYVCIYEPASRRANVRLSQS